MGPEAIQRWLDENAHRLDLATQYLGDEPNAVGKGWDAAPLRWLLAASWPYEQAVGNSSIPAVYRCVNDTDALADRFYLPATPRDLNLLIEAGIGVFGIETKHQAREFDIVATSISYPVLSMSFVKLLTAAGLPARWRERDADPGAWPMVLVGGLSFGAPECLAPVVDCWWLGEVEDEPGNPGIAAVCARITAFTTAGTWRTDRVGCYAELAREFPFLYFPRFVDIHYGERDRSHVGLGPALSKQVIGWSANLDGMAMPLRKRHVRDLDAIPALSNPPLLYADPALGAGDLEVARGCPAWCSFPLAGDEEIITRDGVQALSPLVGQDTEVWTADGWRPATVEPHGPHPVQQIVFRPADRGTVNRAWRSTPRASRRVTVTATPCHGWQLVDGSETHDLAIGDTVLAGAVRPDLDVLPPVGFVHGFLFGDGHQRHTSTGERRPAGSGSFKVRLFGKKAQALIWFEQLPRSDGRDSWADRSPIVVSSIRYPAWAKGDPVVYGWARFNVKAWPSAEDEPSYLEGFLTGWLAADGTIRAHGTSWVLDAQHSPHHGDVSPTDWLARYAASAGWVLVGHSVSSSGTNFGERAAPLVRHSLVRAVDHGWTVESITPVAGDTDVYCLTVPGTHRFTLATGITTGNCALTYRQKPYRQRSVDYTVDYARAMQNNMGSVRLTPFSPDFPMHTQRKALVAALLENVSDEVDASTMRVDDFIADPEFILLQVAGGMDTVTLGVEGNSQRMRDLVGKGTADADICEAVTRGIAAGIRRFKLFMISGLPGEDEGDVYRILKLAKDLADIRESMRQPTVRIQLSWTPLMIEANTPMQWFAPASSSRILGDVFDELRELGIDFKLGAKAEPNKLLFFQLCHRASRDVGEALVDAMLAADTACWGGVPRTFAATLERCLRERGFHNGSADCFDERAKADMFGWEFIDQGISVELLWVTYLQMREFAEQTDSHSYDAAFTADYHGNEWIERCDTRCHGKTCGACDYTDLRIRTGYIRAGAGERAITGGSVTPVDQRSQVVRVRARLDKPERYRFVGNDHWRFALRRAAYRAQAALGWPGGIAKRSIRFASDPGHRDWSCGVDYAEFALTRAVDDDDALAAFIAALNTELRPWLRVGAHKRHPVTARLLAADTDLHLYELAVDADPATLAARLADWERRDDIPLRCHLVGGYFTPATVTVNARDHVPAIWAAHDGHRLAVKMLLRGRPNPYAVYAALMGRASFMDAARIPLLRREVFVPADRHAGTPPCSGCGGPVPVTLLDLPSPGGHCPPCHDAHSGARLAPPSYVS